MIKLIVYLQDHIKMVRWVFYGVLAAILVGSFLVDRHHAHTWPEHHIPFFWSVFGFVAAAVIIIFSFWLGRSGIQARENYYDCPFRPDDCPPPEEVEAETAVSRGGAA